MSPKVLQTLQQQQKQEQFIAMLAQVIKSGYNAKCRTFNLNLQNSAPRLPTIQNYERSRKKKALQSHQNKHKQQVFSAEL